MIHLCEDSNYPLIKMNTNKINFLEEHKSILNKEGYVWFGRYGKRKFSIKINEGEKSKYIILKDAAKSTNRTFICEVVEIENNIPKEGYPEYYKTFINNIIQWFKIINIYEIDTDILFEKFISCKSGKEAKKVIGSIAPIAILKPIENIQIEESN